MAGQSIRTTLTILAGASLVGALVGIGSVATTATGVTTVSNTAKDLAVATGFRRQRDPQPGDHWGGCNDARAAGTAPIYKGEPGYRENMDGDSDGIACEPIT